MTQLPGKARIFLDTAPLIYLIERDARYLPTVEEILGRLDAGDLYAVTSPVSLA
jgi:predicted nucleic acid-binding protein